MAVNVVRPLCIGLMALAMAGCGYFKAGSWDDDPANFERAFESRPPVGTVVIRSKYTRYPHFTLEETYYFHLQLAPSALDRMTKRLTRADNLRSGPARSMVFADAPMWFAPDDVTEYDVWFRPHLAFPELLVLRHRVRGDVFIFGSIL